MCMSFVSLPEKQNFLAGFFTLLSTNYVISKRKSFWFPSTWNLLARITEITFCECTSVSSLVCFSGFCLSWLSGIEMIVSSSARQFVWRRMGSITSRKMLKNVSLNQLKLFKVVTFTHKQNFHIANPWTFYFNVLEWTFNSFRKAFNLTFELKTQKHAKRKPLQSCKAKINVEVKVIHHVPPSIFKATFSFVSSFFLSFFRPLELLLFLCLTWIYLRIYFVTNQHFEQSFME